jgi:hypothetical protein
MPSGIVRAAVVLVILVAQCGGEESDKALLATAKGLNVQERDFEEESDKALRATANDLYVQAREFEDARQTLIALRTLKAASRLLPSDARVRWKLRQVHARVRAAVLMQHQGHTLALPVWVHETPSPVGGPGSADELVRALFLQNFRRETVSLAWCCR